MRTQVACFAYSGISDSIFHPYEGDNIALKSGVLFETKYNFKSTTAILIKAISPALYRSECFPS